MSTSLQVCHYPLKLIKSTLFPPNFSLLWISRAWLKSVIIDNKERSVLEFLGFVPCCFSSGFVVYFIAHIYEITSLLLLVVSWLQWRHYLGKFPTQLHLCSLSDFKALFRFIWEGSLTHEQASHWWQQRQTSGSVLVKSSLGIHLCSEYSSKLEH